MKNILFVVFISMIFLFVCCNTTTNKNIIETEISDFDKILDSFQVNGSILIYDNDKNTSFYLLLLFCFSSYATLRYNNYASSTTC